MVDELAEIGVGRRNSAVPGRAGIGIHHRPAKLLQMLQRVRRMRQQVGLVLLEVAEHEAVGLQVLLPGRCHGQAGIRAASRLPWLLLD